MYETPEKIKVIVQEVAKELGYEIFELTYKRVRGKYELRISIDKRKDNVSLADCEKFSKTIGARLDTEDIIPDSYNLVVESPGAERELRSKKDFERFIGKNVKLLLKNPVEKRMVLIGKLKTLEEETVVIKERDTGNDFETKLNNIKKANLRLEL
ncbi:MAG: ribosome maturation factor RimP [Kosmotoga sp.]|nr:MAG: ribosome maturation factor RimP [Kosmotoga sp.]